MAVKTKPQQQHLKGMEPKFTELQKKALKVVEADAGAFNARMDAKDLKEALLDKMVEKKTQIVKVACGGYLHIYTIDERREVKHTKEIAEEPPEGS